MGNPCLEGSNPSFSAGRCPRSGIPQKRNPAARIPALRAGHVPEGARCRGRNPAPRVPRLSPHGDRGKCRMYRGRCTGDGGSMRRTIITSVVGALVAGTYFLLLRRPVMTWGATSSEAGARLPGDELLEDADGVATRAIRSTRRRRRSGRGSPRWGLAPRRRVYLRLDREPARPRTCTASTASCPSSSIPQLRRHDRLRLESDAGPGRGSRARARLALDKNGTWF